MNTHVVLEFLNSVLQTIALAILPVLAVMIVQYVKQEWKRVHLPEWVSVYAQLAVRAAEQAHLADLVAEKKPYAIAALQAFLDAHGIKLDAAALDAAIEDAVHSEAFTHANDTNA